MSFISSSQRTILGIQHIPSAAVWEPQKALITKYAQEGARSVGLEISPGILNDSAYLKDPFIVFAHHAGELGLKVIPLLSDEVAETRFPYGVLMDFFTPESTFDIASLEARLTQVKQESAHAVFCVRRIDDWTPPETVQFYRGQVVFFQLQTRRLEVAGSYAADIQQNLDVFVQRWQEWVVDRANAEMAQTLQTEQPDLAIVGTGHAKSLTHLPGYHVLRVLNIQNLGGLPDVASSERLQRALEDFIDRKNRPTAVNVYQRLADMVSVDTPGDEKAIRALDQALLMEPSLFDLSLRAFCHIDRALLPFLIPHEDAHFLKITAKEADRRIREALGVFE